MSLGLLSFKFPRRRESLFQFLRIEQRQNLGKKGIISGSLKLQF